VQILQIDPNDIEALPQELRDLFPGVVNDLREGVIEAVPDAVLNQLPASVIDRIPAELLANGVDTTSVIVLAVIAAIALLGFFYGMAKAAAKAAMFFLVVGAVAGFLLYTQL
jgi:hypothetical protein